MQQYVWEALQDETLLILIACAIVSLVVGLTTEVYRQPVVLPQHYLVAFTLSMPLSKEEDANYMLSITGLKATYCGDCATTRAITDGALDASQDPKSGWYDGAGIAFAVICVVLVACKWYFSLSLPVNVQNRTKS